MRGQSYSTSARTIHDAPAVFFGWRPVFFLGAGCCGNAAARLAAGGFAAALACRRSAALAFFCASRRALAFS